MTRDSARFYSKARWYLAQARDWGVVQRPDRARIAIQQARLMRALARQVRGAVGSVS